MKAKIWKDGNYIDYEVKSNNFFDAAVIIEKEFFKNDELFSKVKHDDNGNVITPGNMGYYYFEL